MLYSIGHGTKRKEDFLEELKAFGVTHLIDVRSRPYSRFNPQYNQKALSAFLQENGIRYIFLGDQLGGRPAAANCYAANGKVDYAIIKEQPFFKEGLQRLINAYLNGVPAAIMCSESKPQECHRSLLIGAELLKQHVNIEHIIDRSTKKDQEKLMLESGGKGLFDEV